ncbi:hypothetical protein DPMN_062946 [Dreissena polymorpha]|uniref:Uncharacterized protein n=1 Tax=Dreissena polymorpha TaxID=45954 RepID=A0A9D4CAF3_DREPO|nr:hypothetical protein DPMN_062946 [Dreissena polymorpha]
MATVRQYDGDNAIERWRHCDDTTATVRYDYRIVAPAPNSIERAFGVWKRTFHVLHGKIRMKPAKYYFYYCYCCFSYNNYYLCCCYWRNGACIDGCKQGFYGDVCNSTCSNGCFDRKCRQESGACAEGCIQGRVGVECTDREAGLGRDEIAGAAGGAFVIIVWAAVVIVLVFFVYRRRLKNYDVFNRNTPFSARRKRGSSRRHLRRRSSNSTAGNDVPEIDMEDDVFDNDEGFRHRPCCLHGGRVVTFEEDAPMRCTCKHRASRDFFVCRGYDIHENGQFQHILKESILHEEPINLDMDQIADSIEIKTLSAIRDPEPNVGDNYGDSSEV